LNDLIKILNFFQDIKVKEQSIEALMKGKIVYESPKFMSVNIAASQLLDIINSKQNESKQQLINENSICIALARIGSDNQTIKSCKLKELLNIDLGEPLHSLIIPGKLHPIEIEMIEIFSNN
jgi:diphthine synthase